MAEYIDRDKIINRICNEKCRTEYGKCQKGRDGNKVILCVCDFIRLQEVADVATVVRCRECKHYREFRTKKNRQIMRMCYRMGKHDMEYSVKPDDFCSYGARMDGTDGAPNE